MAVAHGAAAEKPTKKVLYRVGDADDSPPHRVDNLRF